MNEITTKFLANTPLGEDLFEGQSQEKIASVLSEVIKQNDFQVIGIEGSWGTGKSNLVKILDGKLTDYTFFMYDVWGHQEDEQRRAILVELTELLSSNDKNIVKNKQKWKSKLEVLLAKKKSITTTNLPYLSIGFIFSLFAVVYIPAVNVFKDKNDDYFGVDNVFWKIVLVFFPLFIVLGVYVWNLFDGWLFGKTGFFLPFKLSAQKTFQVYTNKQEQETKIESISESEPSVKEFRSWMKEIDSDLGDKKLILVFDNFDRLPKKQILSIWSSIHIFFAEETYKNIKVIIPFDRQHLKNAFSDLDDKNKENDFANDYVNKTFDLVYRVSQPILSDWKKFFRSKWEEAFSGQDEETYIKVQQIYEVFRPSITPREIISFINGVVSYHLLDPTIPLNYTSLFVLNQDEILKDPLKAITESKFLAGLTYIYEDDEDFQKYVTALAYQIDSQNALEVAYRKQLKDSLQNNKPELLVEISKTNVFAQIIFAVLNELENLDNPILALDKLDKESNISESEKQSIWDNIYYRKIKDTHLKFSLEEAHKVLLKYLPVERSETYLKKVVNELRKNEDFDASEFSNIIDDLNTFLKNEQIDIDLNEIIAGLKTTLIPAESLINLIALKQNNFYDYNLESENNEVNEYLCELEIEKLKNVTFLPLLGTKYKLERFKKELINKIQIYKSNTYDKIAVLYDKLKDVSDKPIVTGLSDAEIYSFFTQAPPSEDFYYDLIAMRIARLGKFEPSYSSYFDTVLNSTDTEIAEKVAERIEFYINFGPLLVRPQNLSQFSLYKQVVNKVITKSYGRSKGDLKDLLIAFGNICKTTGIESEVLIKKLNDWYSKIIVPNDISSFPIYLFESCLKVDNDLTKNLLLTANEYLLTYSSEDWTNIFNDFDSNDFELAKAIKFNQWSLDAKEGLKVSLYSQIAERNFKDLENWQYILNSFANSQVDITSILKDVRDKIYNNKDLTTDKIFRFFLTQFMENSILKDKPSEAFRTFIKIEFLDDPDLVDQLVKNHAGIKELLKISNQADVKEFKQAIRDRQDKSELITQLANKLDIRASKNL